MKEDLIEATANLFSKNLETMKKKNTDYSSNQGSISNFRTTSCIVGIPMSKGIMVRLCDKVVRIGNLLDKKEVSSESIFDSIEDLINYAAILHYIIKVEKEEN
jgi:hypothetical protein